jgi:hypothetical protein
MVNNKLISEITLFTSGPCCPVPGKPRSNETARMENWEIRSTTAESRAGIFRNVAGWRQEPTLLRSSSASFSCGTAGVSVRQRG